MSTHDEQHEEEILDAHQTRVEKIRGFLRKNQLPLACGATAGFAFVLGRKVGLKSRLSEIDVIQYEMRLLEGALDESGDTLQAAMEFIDKRKLGEKFAEFVLEQTNGA